METYIDLLLNTEGEKASVVFKKLTDIGLKFHIGEHDFVHDWKKIASISEQLSLADKIQEKLKGTGVLLKFTTIR